LDAFLKEIKDNTTMIAHELLEVPEIAEAIGILNKSSYSKEELMEYDKYWDVVRTQQAFIQDAEAKGEAKGEFKTAVKTAEKLKIRGMNPIEISEITGLSMDEIDLL
jgi:predicted transposase/invertase (TIGR01784 family)